MNYKFERTCNNCNTQIFYLSYEGFRRARKNNSVCKKCAVIKTNENKRGNPPWNKGIPMSTKSKLKLSNSLKGRKVWSAGKKFDEEYIKKLQNSHLGLISGMKGKFHTSKSKEKIRTSILNKLKIRGISAKYNPRACQFIDALNNRMGWNLQHALNGGEVTICGYSVDGYDKEKNIIFEYDEPKHHHTIQKNKDEKRQRELIAHFINNQNPVSFWRYDERYQKLYEVLS